MNICLQKSGKSGLTERLPDFQGKTFDYRYWGYLISIIIDNLKYKEWETSNVGFVAFRMTEARR